MPTSAARDQRRGARRLKARRPAWSRTMALFGGRRPADTGQGSRLMGSFFMAMGIGVAHASVRDTHLSHSDGPTSAGPGLVVGLWAVAYWAVALCASGGLSVKKNSGPTFGQFVYNRVIPDQAQIKIRYFVNHRNYSNTRLRVKHVWSRTSGFGLWFYAQCYCHRPSTLAVAVVAPPPRCHHVATPCHPHHHHWR